MGVKTLNLEKGKVYYIEAYGKILEATYYNKGVSGLNDEEVSYVFILKRRIKVNLYEEGYPLQSMKFVFINPEDLEEKVFEII